MESAVMETDHGQALALRMQAISLGLSHYLTPAQCRESLALWHAKYQRSAKFSLHPFIKELVLCFPQLAPHRHEVQMQIVRFLALDVVELRARYAQYELDPVLPGQEESAGAQAVFEALYQTLLTRLEQSDYETAGRLRKYLRDKLSYDRETGVDPQRLKAWLLGLTAQLDTRLPIDLQRVILHEAYRGLCEYLGPVPTDKLLGQCLRDVEQLPLARVFAPRQLL